MTRHGICRNQNFNENYKCMGEQSVLIIQTGALFVLLYVTLKSKNDNAKSCHDAFLNELKVLCVYGSQSLA